MMAGKAFLVMICSFKFHYIYTYNMVCLNATADAQVYTKEFVKVAECKRKLLKCGF